MQSNENTARDRQVEREERQYAAAAADLVAIVKRLLPRPVASGSVARTGFTDPPVDWDAILARSERVRTAMKPDAKGSGFAGPHGAAEGKAGGG